MLQVYQGQGKALGLSAEVYACDVTIPWLFQSSLSLPSTFMKTSAIFTYLRKKK